MSASLRLRRTLALTSAVVLTSWGTVSVASADPGNGNSSGNGNSGAHGQGSAPGQTKDKSKDDKDKDKGNNGHHNGNGNGGGNGNGNGNGGGNGGGNGDPAGNNGTIKITPLGEQDGTPDNNPHVTCGFQIEWYGFDEGDYYSQVSFAMQSPTKDATITPNGPLSVFVGEDPASGAGTDSGLDARESYYPSFTGTPHPKQGFHVKVTVATPFSHGNDTKSKVFWVQPCADEVAGEEGETPGTTPETPGTTPETPGTGDETPGADETSTTDVLGEQASTGDNNDTEVLGEQANADDTNGTQVPTAVDAGEGGNSALDWVRSPLPLLVIGLGALLAIVAIVSRRRTRADV